jgi:hypothetical protein
MEKPEFKGKVDILITETEFVTIQRLRKRLKNLIVAVQIAPEIHQFKAKNGGFRGELNSYKSRILNTQIGDCYVTALGKGQGTTPRRSHLHP